MVPDVKVKTTAKALIDIAAVLNEGIKQISPPADRGEKCSFSIWSEIRQKLMQKASSKIDEKKPFNFKMKYWIAFEIHLVARCTDLSDEAQKLFDQLDQKLA